MMSQIFRRFLKDENGAVEFIESAVVLSIILASISILIAISLLSIVKVRDGEVAYYKTLDQAYKEKTSESFSSLSKSRASSQVNYKFNKKNGLISTYVTFEENDKLQVKITRINPESLIRKLDFAEDLLQDFDGKTGNITKVKSKIKEYETAISKLGISYD